MNKLPTELLPVLYDFSLNFTYQVLFQTTTKKFYFKNKFFYYFYCSSYIRVFLFMSPIQSFYTSFCLYYFLFDCFLFL